MKDNKTTGEASHINNRGYNTFQEEHICDFFERMVVQCAHKKVRSLSVNLADDRGSHSVLQGISMELKRTGTHFSRSYWSAVFTSPDGTWRVDGVTFISK